MGEGFAPENVIHSLVALADVVVQVSQQRLGASDEVMGFVRAVTQMNFMAARTVVESLAEEMEARRRQRPVLGRGFR
jgi:hypothetical protein